MDRDFLYRIDGTGSGVLLYVVSEREPEREHDHWRLESKPYDPKLEAGDRLAFKVRVNPTIRSKTDGKRHDIVMHERKTALAAGKHRADLPAWAETAQEVVPQWLAKRGAKAGFRLESALVESYDRLRFRKARSSRRVTLGTADTSGTLVVTDPARLRQTLFHGLGAAKGFGCGLMLVRRP